jgi:uncharacterized protein
MLRYLFFVCVVLLAWHQPARALDVIRPKLACFPLAAKTIEAMAYNENISALLVNALNRSGAAELVERKKIEAVIEQHGLRFDAPDQAILRGLGGEAGFNFILTGSVGRDQGKLLLDLTLLAAHSPQENHHWNYRIGDGEVAVKLDEITAGILPILRSFDKAPAAPQATPPAAMFPPQHLQGSGTQRSIKLKWSHPAPERVAAYKIFRATSPDGSYSQVGNSSVPSFSDDSLEFNDSFYYKIKAVGREGGESPFSQAVQGRTTVAPQPPVFMQVEPGIRSAELSWYQRPVSGTDPQLVPVKYRIYRAPLNDPQYQLITEVNGGITTYIDSELPGGPGYRYCLTSVNSAGGESEQSTALQVNASGMQLP